MGECGSDKGSRIEAEIWSGTGIVAAEEGESRENLWEEELSLSINGGREGESRLDGRASFGKDRLSRRASRLGSDGGQDEAMLALRDVGRRVESQDACHLAQEAVANLRGSA